MINLMKQTADVWRPIIAAGLTTQNITGFGLAYAAVPCFIQQADTRLEWYYDQRGTTITAQIYTTATDKIFLREDIFVDCNGNQFHLIANPKPALDGKLYFELHAEQYPEGAKKRLDPLSGGTYNICPDGSFVLDVCGQQLKLDCHGIQFTGDVEIGPPL